MTDSALLAIGGVISFIAMSGGYLYVRPNPRQAAEPKQTRARSRPRATATMVSSKR